MNQMEIFKNPEFGTIRAVEIDGEPWLVGKDVALALGYKNPQEAIRNHVDAEDKGVSEILTPGGMQKLPIINESGLYSLVLSSKLPKAKQFRRWVTSEVLPSIRKHGAYLTEGTFDAYLWQTVENKQRFISQIMTSKSPVRSCDDVDETALSFAEIKALCAGDPRIKERMDLDVDVARLKLMKADHQSKQYHLEDQLLKTFPEEIEKNKGFITGLEADMATLAAHLHPEDGFAGMEVRGDTLTDKENAGAALLDACKEVKGSDPVSVGSYRGFAMSVSFDAFRQEYMLLLKGEMTHRATLGTDPRGNLTRIDNALAQMPQRLEAVKNQLDNLYQQQAAAKAEVGKPFAQEQELRDKSARLAELDVLLNMDGRGRPVPETVIAKSSRPSVLEGLKRPVLLRNPDKKPKHHEQEVR